MGESKYKSVEEIKALRVQVDALIQAVDAEGTHSDSEIFKGEPDFMLLSAAQYQAHIKLIEAKMWLGKMLEGMGNPFPKELADKAE